MLFPWLVVQCGAPLLALGTKHTGTPCPTLFDKCVGFFYVQRFDAISSLIHGAAVFTSPSERTIIAFPVVFRPGLEPTSIRLSGSTEFEPDVGNGRLFRPLRHGTQM